jgi:hypothetical protein
MSHAYVGWSHTYVGVEWSHTYFTRILHRHSESAERYARLLSQVTSLYYCYSINYYCGRRGKAIYIYDGERYTTTLLSTYIHEVVG